MIKSQLLYQLSYAPVFAMMSGGVPRKPLRHVRTVYA
jgi:hypothetical protein